MEHIFAIINENSKWIFGSSSLAGIVVAILNNRAAKKAEKKEEKKDEKKDEKPAKSSGSSRAAKFSPLFYVLLAVAVVSGGVSLSNVTFKATVVGDDSSVVDDSNNINSGANSTNVIIEGGGNAEINN